MTIQEKPYYVDFAGNGAVVKWGCNPTINSGRCGVRRINFLRGLNYGEYLDISAGGSVVRFDGRITLEELLEDIIGNYTLRQYYRMSFIDNVLGFESKTSSIALPIITTNSETAIYSDGLGYATIPPEYKQGYGVLCYIEVTRCNRGAEDTIVSDAFVVPVRDNVAELDLGFLSGFFEGVDLPSFSNNITWGKLRYAWLKYAVHYGEYYNGTARRIFTMPARFAINGSSNDQGLNIPDWDSNIESGNQLSRCPKVQIFGMDNHSVHQVSREGFFFAYLIKFSESNADSVALTCRVSSYGISGIVYSDTLPLFTADNNNIYSIKCSHNAAVALHSTNERLAQSVFSITQAGAEAIEFTLQYREEKKGEKLFVLQSRYGVLFPLSCVVVEENVNIEGDSYHQGKYEQWSKDKVSRTRTARALCSRTEAELIAAAAGNMFNYIVDGDSYLRIGIANDSVKVLDESSDVLSVEFKFTTIYSERITEGRTLWADQDEGLIEIPYNDNKLFSI